MAPGRKLPVIFSVESYKPAIIRIELQKAKNWWRYKVQKTADCSVKRLRHHLKNSFHPTKDS